MATDQPYTQLKKRIWNTHIQTNLTGGWLIWKGQIRENQNPT